MPLIRRKSTRRTACAALICYVFVLLFLSWGRDSDDNHHNHHNLIGTGRSVLSLLQVGRESRRDVLTLTSHDGLADVEKDPPPERVGLAGRRRLSQPAGDQPGVVVEDPDTDTILKSVPGSETSSGVQVVQREAQSQRGSQSAKERPDPGRDQPSVLVGDSDVHTVLKPVPGSQTGSDGHVVDVQREGPGQQQYQSLKKESAVPRRDQQSVVVGDSGVHMVLKPVPGSQTGSHGQVAHLQREGPGQQQYQSLKKRTDPGRDQPPVVVGDSDVNMVLKPVPGSQTGSHGQVAGLHQEGRGQQRYQSVKESADPRKLDMMIALQALPKEERHKLPSPETSPVRRQKLPSGNNDSGFKDLQPGAEDSSDEQGTAQGTWLSPDGAAADLARTDVDTASTERRDREREVEKGNEHVDKKDRHPWEAGRDARDWEHAKTQAPGVTSAHQARDGGSRGGDVTSVNVTVSEAAVNFKDVADFTLYSAFFDGRRGDGEGVVRVVGVGPLSRRVPVTPLWCVFGAAPSQPVPLVVRHSADCLGMKRYCLYNMRCQVPERVQRTLLKSGGSVTITTAPPGRNFNPVKGERVRLDVIINKVSSRDDVNSSAPTPLSSLVSVCAGPVHGKVSVLQLVEWLELLRLTGVHHFTLYTFRVSRELARALAFYQQAGLVSVLPWSLPAPNDVRNKGEASAMADCLLRNTHLFNYVAFLQLHELLVPRAAASLRHVLSAEFDRREVAALRVTTATFYPSRDLAGSERRSDSSRLEMLSSTRRDKVWGANCANVTAKRDSVWGAKCTKFVVRPDLVQELDWDSGLKTAREGLVIRAVDPSTLAVHQYSPHSCARAATTRYSSIPSCDELFEDVTVWRYKDALERRTKDVLREITGGTEWSNLRQ